MRLATLLLGASPLLAFAACGTDSPTTTPGPDSGGSDTSVDDSSVAPDSSPQSDSAPAPDTSPPWDPSQITGLVLWLDGDTAVANGTGHVATWTDKSPKMNDAKTSGDPQKPLLLTGGSGINGHQALRFDGSSSFFTITDNASLQWTASFLIEGVFRHAQATGSEIGPIYNKQTATALNNPAGPSVSLAAMLATPHTAFVEFQLGPNTFIDTDKTDGGLSVNPHRVRTSWDLPSTTLSIQVDQQGVVSVVKTGLTGIDAVGHDAHIGVDPNNFYMKGDLAEVVAVAGTTIAPADVTNLEAYLDKKYGL